MMTTPSSYGLAPQLGNARPPTALLHRYRHMRSWALTCLHGSAPTSQKRPTRDHRLCNVCYEPKPSEGEESIGEEPSGRIGSCAHDHREFRLIRCHAEGENG